MNEGQIGDVFGCTDDVAELRRLAREQGRQSGATLREYMDICEAQSSEIFSLRARIHALETALEPFADIDGEGDEDFPDDTSVTVQFGRTTHYAIKLGDLRRARVAYEAHTAPEAESATGVAGRSE